MQFFMINSTKYISFIFQIDLFKKDLYLIGPYAKRKKKKEKNFKKQLNKKCTYKHTMITVLRVVVPHGVVAKMLDCFVVVSEFKLQSCYYIHFWTNNVGKGMNPLSPQL